MSSTLVLSVCLDQSSIETRNALLESAGYTVVSAFSLKEAVDRFRDGDFDLIVLSHSPARQDRDRLIGLIRASGSRIPVVFVAAGLELNGTFADLTVESEPDSMLKEIDDALLKAATVASWPRAVLSEAHNSSSFATNQNYFPSQDREQRETRKKSSRETLASPDTAVLVSIDSR